MANYNDYPIDVCARSVDDLKKRNPNATFFQKWTCTKCGERVTGSTPDMLFLYGYHDDCGHTTNITQTGCNFMVHFAVRNPQPKGVL